MSKKESKDVELKLKEDEIPEFLRTVYDDIVFLQSINYTNPSRTEVRLSSSVLRRLLYEHMIEFACQIVKMPEPPKIEAIDLEAVIGELPRRYIHYAYAGGAPTKPAQHAGYVLLSIPEEEVPKENKEAFIKEISEKLSPGKMSEFNLKKFCLSPSVISGNSAVSRLDVVRYVANKLGGVHWDNKRSGWSSYYGSRALLLDEQHIIVGGLPGTFYEVVSIAYALTISTDIQKLLELIDKKAPEPEYSSQVLKFREGRIGKYSDLTFTSKSA